MPSQRCQITKSKLLCCQQAVSTRMLSNEEPCLRPHLAVGYWHQPWAAAELCLNIPGEMPLAVLSCPCSSHPPGQHQPNMKLSHIPLTTPRNDDTVSCLKSCKRSNSCFFLRPMALYISSSCGGGGGGGCGSSSSSRSSQ